MKTIRSSRLSFAMRTALVGLATLLMAVMSGARQSGDDDESLHCERCHTCDVPTAHQPCLVSCPRIQMVNQTTSHDLAEAPDTIVLDILADLYQPVYFAHELHATMAEMGDSCAICHHYSPPGHIPPCRECHDPESQSGDLAKPNLKGAYHPFMVNEPLAGKRYTKVTKHKTKKDWALLIRYISDKLYPKAETITLVMDNFGTHSASALYERFPPEEAKRIWDRFEFVFTPKHGSWLNMAEIELNVLITQCLNRRIDKITTIKSEIKAWRNHRNNKNAIIKWQFTTKDARVKLHRLYPSIQA